MRQNTYADVYRTLLASVQFTGGGEGSSGLPMDYMDDDKWMDVPLDTSKVGSGLGLGLALGLETTTSSAIGLRLSLGDRACSIYLTFARTDLSPPSVARAIKADPYMLAKPQMQKTAETVLSQVMNTAHAWRIVTNL